MRSIFLKHYNVALLLKLVSRLFHVLAARHQMSDHIVAIDGEHGLSVLSLIYQCSQ